MENVFVLTIEERINGATASSIKVYESYCAAKNAMREAIARELAPTGRFGKLIAKDPKSVFTEDKEKYVEIYKMGARSSYYISYDISCQEVLGGESQEVLGCEITKERAIQLIQSCINWIASPGGFDSYSDLMGVGFDESELRALGYGYIVDEAHKEDN